MNEKIGEICRPDPLSIMYSYGEKKTYTLHTSAYGEPIVREPKTGRYFIIKWADIITMAERAGL